MADTKISALPAATTPLAGTEVLPIVQSGATDKVSVDNLTAGRAVSAASYTPTGATVPTNGIYAPAANQVAIANNGIQTLLTNANNDVQIGSATGATAKVFVYANNSAGDAAGNAAVVLRQDGTNHIQTWTGAGGSLKGYWTSAGNLVIADQNLVIGTSGKGIDFSATPGTGTSELLSDYEEGTFTPVFVPASGAFTSVTYITQTGRYTKIGRTVTINIYLLTSGITVGTASGAVKISGLPFTCDNQTYYAVPFGGDVRLFGGDTPSAAQVDINSTNVSLWYRTAANGATTALDVTDLGTGGADNLTILSGTYFV
jgi:hypothetical protein